MKSEGSIIAHVGVHRFAVLGAGGHARVVISLIRSLGHQVLAASAMDPQRYPDGFEGLPVYSDRELIEKFSASTTSERVQLAVGIGGVEPLGPSGGVKSTIVGLFRESGLAFPALVHAAAWIAPGVSLGHGVQVHAGSMVQPGSRIGKFSILNTCCSIDHDSHVGDFCHVAPGATISGDVKIGDGTHLGTGSSVIQGIRIGAGVMVAAGATVICDVPDHARVRGVPAKLF